jgi:hypothetical protein
MQSAMVGTRVADVGCEGTPTQVLGQASSLGLRPKFFTLRKSLYAMAVMCLRQQLVGEPRLMP